MRVFYYTAFTILLLGGLNWGYVGVAGVDVFAALFGQAPAVVRTLYALVAISAVYVGYCNLLWPEWVKRNIVELNDRPLMDFKRNWKPL